MTAAPPPAAPESTAEIVARTAAVDTTVSASTKIRTSPTEPLAPAFRTHAIWRHAPRTTRAPAASAIAAV
jgi:hypothetical protein